LFFLCAALIALSFADPEVRPIDKAIRQLTAMKAAPFERCVEGLRSEQGLMPLFEPTHSEVLLHLRLPSVFFWTLPQTIEEFNIAFRGSNAATAVQVALLPGDYEEARKAGGSGSLEEIGLTCQYWKEGRPKRKVAFLSDGTPVILSYTEPLAAKREVLEDCTIGLHWTPEDTSMSSDGDFPASTNIELPLKENMLSTIQWGGSVITKDCLDLLKIPYTDASSWLVFKALLPYWPEIYGMTPDEAIRYLRARHEAEHRPVSLLGVSFESPVVFNVAPPLLLFFLILFSTHLKQLQRQLEDGKAIEDPSVWVALYPSREALGLIFFAALVLPIAASFSLVVRLEDPMLLHYSAINAVVVLACIGLSWRNTRALLRIRSLVFAKESPILPG